MFAVSLFPNLKEKRDDGRRQARFSVELGGL